MTDYLWIVIALPLAAALLNHFAGRRMGEPRAAGPAVLAVVGAFAYAAVAARDFFLSESASAEAITVVHLFDWMPGLGATAELLWDPLSATMTLVVTGVGALIHIYAVGYMHGDPRFSRFFTYLNLFIASMLILVLANNFALLFVGWELVGLCSYLLISFWYTRPEAAAAGKKAFVVNRIGDFGFMVALMLVFTSFGTLSYTEVLHEPGQVIGATTATAIGLLLLVGAAGKSAQLPLYVWLPDAMEGPTPVSALIHAATMVTAGVYMVARTGAIYGLSDVAGGVVATVGALTALLAATIAIAQRDIKRVLAYSTISQLGYMFMAVGIGGYVAGLFHLVTHAVFKALLFLGAGSVIHALADEQDMNRMGGLRSKMPITHATMLVATLSIAGIPPLAGFWSKDEILAVLFAKGGYFTLLWGIGLLTALLTAFYMARQYFLVFDGKARWDDGVQPHESPRIMTGPLVVLGVLTVLIGFVNTPFRLSFEHFLEPAFEGVYLAHAPEDGFLLGALALVSVAAGVVGFAIAFLLYRHASEETRDRLLGKVRRPLMASENGYWVDDVYGTLIVKPGMRIALWSAGAVDQRTIDGLVNGVGVAVRRLGRRLRPLQSGFVRSYGAMLAAGAVGIVAWIVARGL
ncbi:MAG: NADH-quinone oxidoreductase subunit L [bacterium]|nr:NADH-quinone oxidoreductase subunit L [bacterium]MDE0290395.1 NADH-quinone oxidoreductase subunit L [bacterium]MDE0437841.1 NADH-quinone oxidoreductase subunit L [bacterium]